MTVIRDQVVLFYTGVGYHQTYILDIDDRECRQWLKRQKVVYGGIMVDHKFVNVSESLFDDWKFRCPPSQRDGRHKVVEVLCECGSLENRCIQRHSTPV